MREARDIQAEILSFALEKGKVTSTGMFYVARISWSQCCRFRKVLLERGLIMLLSDGKKAYQITPKGEEWLNQYDKLKELEL